MGLKEPEASRTPQNNYKNQRLNIQPKNMSGMELRPLHIFNCLTAESSCGMTIVDTGDDPEYIACLWILFP